MEVWRVKTGDLSDLLLGHQNGQRNEATLCVNESGNQNPESRMLKAGRNGKGVQREDIWAPHQQ
jgi:hypothetical protein